MVAILPYGVWFRTTVQEGWLIFSWLKKSCFLKWTLLLKFWMRWHSNIFNLLNIWIMLNKYYTATLLLLFLLSSYTTSFRWFYDFWVFLSMQDFLSFFQSLICHIWTVSSRGSWVDHLIEFLAQTTKHANCIYYCIPIVYTIVYLKKYLKAVLLRKLFCEWNSGNIWYQYCCLIYISVAAASFTKLQNAFNAANV